MGQAPQLSQVDTSVEYKDYEGVNIDTHTVSLEHQGAPLQIDKNTIHYKNSDFDYLDIENQYSFEQMALPQNMFQSPN